MFPTDLRSRLGGQDAVVGAWMMLRDPLPAELASKAGYDYVCIDNQHGMTSYDTTSAMLAAVATGPAVPIVRIPWNEPGDIGRALDAGALGVIVPMVNTPAEAAAAVSACRYAPVGTRSIGPLGAGVRYGATYAREANERVAVIVMIETVQAVDEVGAIAAVPGVDALYVGPADLSLSLGLAPAMEQDSAAFDDALARVVAAADDAGVIPGIQTNVDLAAKRRQQGFRMLTLGYDWTPMAAALHRSLADARAALGLTSA